MTIQDSGQHRVALQDIVFVTSDDSIFGFYFPIVTCIIISLVLDVTFSLFCR
jgi:hypothetical protein